MMIDRFVDPVLSLPRIVKRGIALSVDAGLCVITVWLAFCLRLGEWVPLSDGGWPAALVSLAVALPIFVVSGFYRAVFRHVGFEALALIVQALVAYCIIYAAIFTAFGFAGVPRTVGIIQPALLLIAIGVSRGIARYWLGRHYRRRLRGVRRNVMIYGAGSAGQQLAGALAETRDTRLVGFLDDDRQLHGSVVGSVRVYDPAKLIKIAEKLEVDEIYLALPSTSRSRRADILALTRKSGVAVRTLPGLLDLASGKVTVSDLRPLEIDDLLGRSIVPPDSDLIKRSIAGRVVMVTGAGGSIGSELCRQIIAQHPSILILVEINEFGLYSIHRELEHRVEADGQTTLVPLLASVCDEGRMRRIFGHWQPDVIYHAAAYKHVPLVEYNVVEGAKNNVIGSATCARLACEFGAARFVQVSTDKAVRPTNIMGATKRTAELFLQAKAAESNGSNGTCISMVRFGNVLGSSGSVVPLFRQQIANGGPVTVTHHEVTRYFMTIPEAAQLVIQAGAMAEGGEVFVLDMGEPVLIADLAKRMIELSGLRMRGSGAFDADDDDIEIVYSGLRPGEKLYEELLIGNNPSATTHPRIMMAVEPHPSLSEIERAIDELVQLVLAQDAPGVRAWLCQAVPEFTPTGDLVDLMP